MSAFASLLAAQDERPKIVPDPVVLQKELDRVIPLVERAAGLSFVTPPKVRFVEYDEWKQVCEEEAKGVRDMSFVVMTTLGFYRVAQGEVVISPLVWEQIVRVGSSGEKSEKRLPRAVAGGLPHELAHALAEQHFGLGARMRAEKNAMQKQMARALVEGFAMTVETRILADEYGEKEESERLLGRERGGNVVYARGHCWLQYLEREQGRDAMWSSLRGDLPDAVAFARHAAKPSPLVTTTDASAREARAYGLRVELRAAAADRTPSRQWGLEAPARRLVFSPDGALLVAVCVDGALRVLDARASDATPFVRTIFCGASEASFAGGVLEVEQRSGGKATFALSALHPTAGDAADLRPELERLALPIRRQGPRGTCSVFAAAGAFEYALSRASQSSIVLSVEYLNWAGNDAVGRVDDGSFFGDVIAGWQRHGACREASWPYGAAFDANARPSDEAVAEAKELFTSSAFVHWIHPLKPKAGLEPRHLDAIRTTLRRGWPVCLGSSHSTLAVGYRDDATVPGGGAIVVRDSATGTYRELDYAFVLERIGDVFWVELAGR